jgi:hypothetical protein
LISLDIAAGAFSGTCRDPVYGFFCLPSDNPGGGHLRRHDQRVTVRTADLVAPALVPEIVTLLVLRTAIVVTVKVAVVAPAWTVTLDGTVATFVLLLESWTVTPAEGAALLRVTVPVDWLPPTTVDGFKLKADNAGPGVIVSAAVFVTPLETADIVATVDEETGFVLTLKLAVVAPCGTVTEGGTVADVLLLERVTTTLAVAAPVSVTVPVEEFPPTTLVGFTDKEDSATVEVELNVALTDCAEFIVTLQAPVPLQAPPQPANVELESGAAAKLTTVPLAKLAEHVVPQEIPEGVLVTAPVPVPLLDTVRVKGPAFAVKVAPTDLAASMVTLQAPVPVQAPLQPANVEPESGVAVRFTTVPLSKLAEHVVPQEIPAGELATIPVPVPLFVTVRVKDVEDAPVINLLRTFVVAC